MTLPEPQLKALKLLRDPNCSPTEIQRIVQDYSLIKHHRIKVAVVQNPNTPIPTIQALIRHLFWRDLAGIADNNRVAPRIRRLAETLLRELIQEMTLGEKLTLARTANRSIIPILRKEKDPRVIQNLLINSRLIEEDVMAMAQRDGNSPHVLSMIATHPRWKARNPVRLALIRNPQTPVFVSRSLLRGLLVKDLRAISSHPALSFVLRKEAKKILEELDHRLKSSRS